MSSYKKFIIILIAILTVAAAATAVYFMVKPKTSTPVPNQSVRIEGTIECLPHKDTSGPQTLECAAGLRTDDGKHYGLRNLPQEDFVTNKRVEISGDYLPAEDNTIYDIIGNVDVEVITSR